MKPRPTSPELETFDWLLVELNGELQMLQELYAAEHLAILDRAAPIFFDELRERLLHHLIQSICRLFDPVKTAGQLNLSLDAIASLPEVSSISADLRQRIAAVRPLWERHLMIWRHKRIAHSDAAAATGKTPLPDLPWADVRNIVAQVSEIGREIHHRLDGADHDYRPHYGPGWVPELLKVLNAGLAKQDVDRIAALGQQS